MAEPGWVRHALRVGRFEFRRSVRELWRDKARFALTALGVVLPSVVVAGVLVLLGDAIRGVEPMPMPDGIRGTVALFWLFAVFLVAQRVASARPRPDAEALLLTTVSARSVAAGLALAETLRILAYFGLPTLVVTGASVALLGSPASVVAVPAAVVLFAATVVVAGSAVGYAAAWLVATSLFVARHKTALGSVASLAAMGGYFLFLYPGLVGLSGASLAWLPVGWVADLAVVGTPLVGSTTRLAGVLLVSAVVLLGGGALVDRETTALWFTDPVSVDADESGAADERSSVDATPGAAGEQSPAASGRDALADAVEPLAVPRSLVSEPVRRVAEWVLLRTRRDPNRLTFLLIPAMAFGSPVVSTAVQSGSTGALLAPLCAVVLPWFAGSLFAMNPLGDEGRVLPVTLTAVSGRAYVRGLLVPGLLVGLPVVVVAAAVAGLLSPYSPAERVGLVALGAYLTCVAVAVTPAVGMALPRFSAISVGQSREVLPPRMSAVAVHAALTVLPGGLLAGLVVAPAAIRMVFAGAFGFAPALALRLLAASDEGTLAETAAWFADVGEAVGSVGIAELQVVLGGGLLVGGVAAAGLLYRYAVGRFDRYVPP
ncbi:hypothetical protein [Halorussus halobius]|uniref:hypothetical protein n=1 Tax=Halorussus halobius TaxID=1710537 RepID=UPI0010920F5F|nr:hypothetical protein [Halorussus halobius]